MVQFADFDTVYSAPTMSAPLPGYTPDAKPSFIGSYCPITPAGQMGPFMVNTYFLRDDRKSELFGSAANREFQMCGR